MKNVVFGLYGSTKDKGGGRRWERWRPTIDVCRQAALPIHRFELLHNTGQRRDVDNLVRDIGEVSPTTQVRPQLVPLEDPWDFEEVFAALHSYSKSYPFKPESERYLVHITTGTHVAQICWFLLTETRHFPAELLQTSPPLEGPRSAPGRHSTINLDLSKYDGLARRFQAERQEDTMVLKQGIQTRSAAFNTLIEGIERVATRSAEPILITGPTGAGKSQLARQIYELKHSKGLCQGQFVGVNCATLRGDGAMSALFGHKRGAFTGAVNNRPGLLKSADGGLLFLDEIGELGLDEQAMLLKAIEEKRFLPIGTDVEATSDFQLIAGTNSSLKDGVRSGRFREDLLARINLWTFELPGLAERSEDLEPNLDFELGRASERLKNKVTVNQEGRSRFLSFATSEEGLWPANFRDFSAAVLRMATLAPAFRIDAATVSEELERLRSQWAQPEDVSKRGRSSLDALPEALQGVLTAEDWDSLDPFDRPQLALVAETCRRHKSLSAAGRQLFSRSRTRRASVNDSDRLRKYLARFGVSFDMFTQSTEPKP